MSKKVNIDFLTDESAILVIKVTAEVVRVYPELAGSLYFAEKLNTNESVKISMKDGRMLFNGQDIETEDFMAIVGMCDAVDESPQSSVVFKGEGDMWD